MAKPATPGPEAWRDWIAEKRRTVQLDSRYWEDSGTFVRPIVDVEEKWGDGFETRDGAVRATWSRADGGNASLHLRRTYAADGSLRGAYTANFNDKTIAIMLRSSESEKKVASWPLPSGVDMQKEHTFELRAVGDQLTVLFDGQVAGTILDSTVPGPGGFGIWAKKGTTVRSIEYRALDGSKPPPATTPASPTPTSRTLPPPPTVSIPGLPDLPPLTIPPGEPGLVKEIDVKGGYVHDLKLLPDSRRMLLMHSQFDIQLYDLEKQAVLWTVDTKGKDIRASALSQDGSRFVTFGKQTADGKPESATNPVTNAVITLRRTSDGSIIQDWTVPTKSGGANTDYVALSPTGKRIAARVKTISGNEKAYETTFIGLEEGKAEPVAEWQAPGHNGHTMQALDEDRFFSTGNGEPVMFRFSKPGSIEKLPAKTIIFGSALSPDRHWLLAHEQDADAEGIWNTATWQRLPFAEGSRTRASRRAFTGNDLALIIREAKNPADKRLLVWDLKSSDQLASFTSPKAGQGFADVLPSANGRFCVARVIWEPKPPPGEDSNTLHLQIWRLPQPGSKPKATVSSQPLIKVPGLPDLPPLTIPPGEPGLVKRITAGAPFLGDFKLLPDSRRILLFKGKNTMLLDLERESPV